MNTICITGRMTQDIDNTHKDCKSRGRFTLAHQEGWGDNPQVDFINCYVYQENLLDRMTKAGVKKGSAVEIIGAARFISKKNEDGSFTNTSFIIVDNWNYCMINAKPATADGVSKPTAPTAPAAPSGESEQAPNFDGLVPTEDNIPF